MQNRVSSAWDSSGITKEERREGAPVAADATEMPREPDEEGTILSARGTVACFRCAFCLFGISLLRRGQLLGAVLWHGGEGGGGCGILTPS